MEDLSPGSSLSERALTVAVALEKFRTTADLEPKRRALIAADMKQAIKRYPGLAHVAVNGRAMRPFITKLKTSKRDKNIRANVRTFLSWSVGALPRSSRETSLSQEWSDLLDTSKLPRHDLAKLMRFARYCSGENIKPSDVSDSVVDGYMVHIVLIASVSSNSAHRKELVRTWNGCRRRVSGWPPRILSKARVHKKQLFPRTEELGEKLASQIDMCFERLGRSPFDTSTGKRKRVDRRLPSQGGPPSSRKALLSSTIDGYKRYARRAARILTEQLNIGYGELELAALVDTENVETILNVLGEELEEAGRGERSRGYMANALLCMARNYFFVPKNDLDIIKNMVDQLDRPEAKLTPKNVGRLRAIFLDKRLELLRLPAVLINNALKRIRNGCARPQDLVDAKVGVAIAILLNIPLRKANLVALRCVDNIKLPGRPNVEGRLVISGELVKNKEDIDRPIPVDLVNLLRVYIREVLPSLRSNPSSTALFPGAFDDSCQVATGFGTCISRRIARDLGLEMNAHLFRHLAAISYLEDHPGEYEVVRLLLGNRDLEVIKRFYTGLEKDAALRKVGGALAVHKRMAGLSSTNMLDITRVGRKPSFRAKDN